jgi:hypothetical protein
MAIGWGMAPAVPSGLADGGGADEAVLPPPMPGGLILSQAGSATSKIVVAMMRELSVMGG